MEEVTKNTKNHEAHKVFIEWKFLAEGESLVRFVVLCAAAFGGLCDQKYEDVSFPVTQQVKGSFVLVR